MSDDLFEKIIDDCSTFELPVIEPFLHGEPFVDGKILQRIEYIRKKLPQTKLRIYSNGYALSPDKIDFLQGMGIDTIYISINSVDPRSYRQLMGLDFERTKRNIAYLTDSVRREKIAKRIVFRMTRTATTSLKEQVDFIQFCKVHKVKHFIVGLFNYAGEIKSALPVPSYPCEHVSRIDILSNGKVTLCCMDEEGQFELGDVNKNSVLEIYNGQIASRYRRAHRNGKRNTLQPCSMCNVFWPGFDHLSPLRKIRVGLQAAFYFLRYQPSGKK